MTTTWNLANFFKDIQASFDATFNTFDDKLMQFTYLFKELETETKKNMAKLSEDVAMLHTQFCDDYVAEDLVTSTDDQMSNLVKLIVSFPSSAYTSVVNALAPCLETL